MSKTTEIKQQPRAVTTTFSVAEKRVPCPHKFQFYVDYGQTQEGPWVKVGLNTTEFGVGYLPKPKPKARLEVATLTAV